jgi:hypothetical protein
LLDIDATADYYGCTSHEIRRRHRRGLMPRGLRPGGNKLFWDERDLDADIEAQKQKVNAT